MSSEMENMGTANTAEAGSQAVVPIDMDTAIVVAGEVNATEVGQSIGGGVEEIAAEAGLEDDGKVKEGEKKEARKKMDSRSEMWKHFKKILIDGVLQKGNYAVLSISATLINSCILFTCRYKLSEYTQFAILEMYGDEKGPKVWAAVNKCLRDLFEEYRVKYAPQIASVQASFSVQAEASGGRASLMKSVFAKKMRLNNVSSSCNKSELDKFLAEEPEDDGPKFDILAWWKVNSSRFPVLACLARDVLAIPISTVASESAFSTGGRVLDDFRTSLTPFMVEALVCTQDWLRRTTPIDIAENTAELTKLEQELIAEYKDIKAKASKSNTRSTTKPTS